MTELRRRFVATRAGRLHIAECGEGPPVLLLHQTPRSWDEFRDVLPLLGTRFRAIALDTPGFGDSAPLAAPSIEGWAGAAVALLDALDLERAHVVGHHTGAAIAMEIAAAAPARAGAVVLSACPLVDAARRAATGAKVPIDTAAPQADGSHLMQLWRGRQPFYPADPALLDRYVVDALRAGPLAAEGHRVVNRYRMEARIGRLRGPVLILAATDDPHSYPATRGLQAAIPGAETVEIAGGTVPLPDAMPAAFSAAVLGFLLRHADALGAAAAAARPMAGAQR